MARKARSAFAQKRLIEKATAEIKYKERARQYYNYLYRKSRFYKFSVYFRLITLLFSFYIVYFNKLVITSVNPEIVSIYDVEETHFGNRTDSKDHKSIYLTTSSKNKYTIDLLSAKADKFKVNDTILVSKNIFFKNTYVTKPGSDSQHILVELARCNNYLMFIIGFILFSFLLKDGYDKFSRVFMWSVLLFNIIGITLYIIT